MPRKLGSLIWGSAKGGKADGVTVKGLWFARDADSHRDFGFGLFGLFIEHIPGSFRAPCRLSGPAHFFDLSANVGRTSQAFARSYTVRLPAATRVS